VERGQALVAEVAATIPTLEGERRATLFELTALLGRTPSEARMELDWSKCRRRTGRSEMTRCSTVRNSWAVRKPTRVLQQRLSEG